MSLDPRQMPNNDLRTLKRLNDNDLIQWLSGWKPDSENRIKGEWELWRRKTKWTAYRAWLSIVLSSVAIVVSFFSLFKWV